METTVPAVDLALDADFAAGLMREAENLAEAEAGALADGLGGEEGLEGAVEHIRTAFRSRCR